MSSLCNPPELEVPLPSFDIVALALAVLAALQISLPDMPTIPFPSAFCPLDDV